MYKDLLEEARYMLQIADPSCCLSLLRTGSDQPQIVQIPFNYASQGEEIDAAGALFPCGRPLPEHQRFLHFKTAQPNFLLESLDDLGINWFTGNISHIKHILSHFA